MLTSLTKSRPYLFFKMPVSEKETGNLIRAINRNSKDAIHNAVVNDINNSMKPVIF